VIHLVIFSSFLVGAHDFGFEQASEQGRMVGNWVRVVNGGKSRSRLSRAGERHIRTGFHLGTEIASRVLSPYFQGRAEIGVHPVS
jgi:hypothetical protein